MGGVGTLVTALVIGKYGLSCVGTKIFGNRMHLYASYAKAHTIARSRLKGVYAQQFEHGDEDKAALELAIRCIERQQRVSGPEGTHELIDDSEAFKLLTGRSKNRLECEEGSD